VPLRSYYHHASVDGHRGVGTSPKPSIGSSRRALHTQATAPRVPPPPPARASPIASSKQWHRGVLPMLHRPPPRASTMPAHSSPPPSQHHLILHCADASSLTDPAINGGDRSTGLAPTSTSAHDAPVWEANASESPDLFPLKSVPRRPLMP
jgi:hypothetical protein